MVRNPVEFENIEALRQREGIDDVELHHGIRSLRVGDVVKLTIVTAMQSFPGQSILVRITRINGSDYRGKLVSQPAAGVRPRLQAGAAFVFSAANIHSILKGQTT